MSCYIADMPMHRTLNKDFFKKWSSQMAYVLGFFAADGSMIKNNRDASFIEFTITDKIVLENIQRVTGSSHRIAVRERGGNNKTAYRLQIGSREWFSDLTKLGFTQNKSNTLRFPYVPKEYFGDFVRGYFDGDGCVYFQELTFTGRPKKRFVLMTLFTGGSPLFLKNLWANLKKRGVTGGSFQKKNRGFELKFSHNDSVALYRLMYHTANTSNLHLPRKREKLERAIQALGLGMKLRE